MAIFRANPAAAQSDPILHEAPRSPCQVGADYVPDADGEPVVPADVGAARVPVPDQVVIPLTNHRRGQQSGYVVLDDKAIEPLVNPKPCR